MDFRSIHNYYEHLVLEYMRNEKLAEPGGRSSDFLLDVACYALSKLPARYMRHEIDMAFYLGDDERRQMQADVKKAVDEAIVYIDRNFNKGDRYESGSKNEVTDPDGEDQ